MNPPKIIRNEENHRAIMAALKPNERLPYLLGSRLNETLWGKRAGMLWTRIGARPVLNQIICDRLQLRGEENLPDRSFILAANHRTWFDLYAITISFWPLYEDVPFLYCPVRSNYYYERPLGAVLNMAVAGYAMYPPIFRDDRGPALNRLAVESCTRLLNWSPRTIIGIHPEGTRSTSESPYEFLPPKSGVGYIAHDSKAPVIPAFVAGLPRQFGRVARDRFRKGVEPIRVWLGAPVDMGELYDAPAGREVAHEIAERTMAGIRALGDLDRAYMETWKP
jgi:1-acyl-sn-glycerol-3-phosphate acyltransferase